MKPPSGGPAIGPTIAGMVNHASAETSSDFGTLRNMTSRPTGTIIAPPIPCTMRARTKSVSVDAKPQNIDPSMKMASASRKMGFAPKRSAIQPLTGINTASDKR